MNTFDFDFNIQNVFDGQAIGISITGMLIVFSGLLLISIFIALLPIILNTVKTWSLKRTAVSKVTVKPVEKKVDEKPADSSVIPVESAEDESNDIASVIGLVLQLEQERLSHVENEQITFSRNSQQPSMWGKAGKMRKMPQRRTHA